MPSREDHNFPFYDRPDMTPFLVHLTKNTRRDDGCSAYDNLVNILKEGEIWASNSAKGFIKGPNPATCFMDIPFASLKHVLTKGNRDPKSPRYEPYGIVVTKQFAYRNGCRPVLYLSNDELDVLGVPADELWRVVRLEGMEGSDINWLHEREWRIRGDFPLPDNAYAAIVHTTEEARKLTARIRRSPDSFAIHPASIIPATVLCHGLPY